jgi:predicted MFS family arabinose efflux permease
MSGVVAKQVVLPIGLLAAAGFLSSAGARVIDPLLSAVASDFHVSIAEVSIVIAAFTLPYGMNQILLGPIGDRFGKLRVMLGALLGYSLATLGCALSPTLASLTFCRVLAGASSAGLIPVCLAYIGDSVPYEDRQATLGRFLTGVTVALMVAGPIGGAFGEYVSWRGVFMLLSAAALCTCIVLAIRLRALPDRRHDGATFHINNYVMLLGHSEARALLLLTIVEGALFAGSFPFLAPYLHAQFGLTYEAIGLVLATFGLGAFVYTRWAKQLVKGLGESGMVLAGGGLIAIAVAVGMASPYWEVFIPVELALGAGYLLLHGVLQARATELLPDARATSVASFVFMLFLGQAVGALAIGYAIGRFGYHAAFSMDAIGIALLTLWLSALMRRPPVRVSLAR